MSRTIKRAGQDRGSPPLERRYLTVGFCDIVGSTLLSERFDPEKITELFKRFRELCQECVHSFGGNLVSPAGDGVMFEFGYPQAHENDTERALLAALSVMEQVKSARRDRELPGDMRLQARIGVCSGLVLVGPESGASWRLSNSIIGEAANLACRLQSLAGPDEIVVAQQTLDAVRGLFDVRSLGPVSVTGASRQIEAAELLRRSFKGRRSLARLPLQATPFVGRADQLGALKRVWEDTRASGTLRVAEVRGEAGIGKSRLVDHFRIAHLGEGPFLCLNCFDTLSNVPLHPFIHFLCERAGIRSDDPQAAKLDRIMLFLRGMANLPPQDPDIVCGLIGIAGPHSSLTPRQRKNGEFALFLGLIEALCGLRSTCMLIEDGHWLDPSSIELLPELFRRLGHSPVLVVLTSRVPSLSKTEQLHVVVELQALTVQDSYEVARSISRNGAVGQDTLTSIVRAADGIPFFIEQLMISRVSSPGLTPSAADHHGARHGLTLPLAELLFERMDRHPGAKSIMRIISALAHPTNVETIATLLDMPGAKLAKLLGRLVAEQILSRRDMGSVSEYDFRHALLQQACYDSMTAASRVELHRRVCQFLRGRSAVAGTQVSNAVLARHLFAGNLYHEAAETWLKAGIESARRSANVEALEFLDRAVASAERIDTTEVASGLTLRVLVAKVGPLAAIRGFSAPEIRDCCSAGLELCRTADAGFSFPFLYAQFMFQVTSGHVADALGSANRFITFAHQHGYEPGDIIGGRLRSVAFFTLGKPADAEREIRRSIAAYRPDRDESIAYLYGANSKVTGQSLLSLILFYRGNVIDGATLGSQTLRDADEIRHPLSTGIAFAYIQFISAYSDLPEVARVHSDRMIAFSTEHRLRIFTAYGEFFKGWSGALLEDLEGGIELMKASISRLEDYNWRLTLPSLLGLLGDRLNAARRYREARLMCSRAHTVAAAGGERWGLSEVLRVEAIAVKHAGRTAWADSAGLIMRAVEVAQANGSLILEARALTTATDLLGRSPSTSLQLEHRLSEVARLVPKTSDVEAAFSV